MEVNIKLIENAGEHNGRSGDCACRPILPPSGSSPPARPGKGQPTLSTFSTFNPHWDEKWTMHNAGRLISVEDEIVQLKIKYIDSDKSNQLHEISGKKVDVCVFTFSILVNLEIIPFCEWRLPKFPQNWSSISPSLAAQTSFPAQSPLAPRESCPVLNKTWDQLWHHLYLHLISQIGPSCSCQLIGQLANMINF